MDYPDYPPRKKKTRSLLPTPSLLRRRIESEAMRDMLPHSHSPTKRKKAPNRT